MKIKHNKKKKQKQTTKYYFKNLKFFQRFIFCCENVIFGRLAFVFVRNNHKSSENKWFDNRVPVGRERRVIPSNSDKAHRQAVNTRIRREYANPRKINNVFT